MRIYKNLMINQNELPVYLFYVSKYIEDIYSFAVNTINIFKFNISIFTSAKHE